MRLLKEASRRLLAALFVMCFALGEGVDYEIPPERGVKPLTWIQEAAEVGVETAGIRWLLQRLNK